MIRSAQQVFADIREYWKPSLGLDRASGRNTLALLELTSRLAVHVGVLSDKLERANERITELEKGKQ